MNITLIKLKGVVRELHLLRLAVERIADCQEMQLIEQGYTVRPTVSKLADSMAYVDEEMDWARENLKGIKEGDDEQT